MTTLKVGGVFPTPKFWREILLTQRYYKTEGVVVHRSYFRMGWMQINSFLHPKELRHLASRLAALAAGVYLQVSNSDPRDRADIHADLCFSFH